MDDRHANQALDQVKQRFSLVDLDHPVNALLFSLALDRQKTHSDSTPFEAGMQVCIPNTSELMRLRSKVSLLPLDGLTKRIKLPSLPGIVLQLQEALEQGASSDQLADLIQTDPKLTTAIISLVNSPLYGQPSEVISLSRAITLMGTREVSSLAFGARLLAMFEDAAPEGLPLDVFWKHSIATAVFAHDLAVHCGRSDPDRYMVAGLLHDLGRVMMFSHYPEQGMVAMALQQEKSMPLHVAEARIFDVDHTLVGSLFFAEWNLPKDIVHAALCHHDPDKCKGKDVAEIVYMANQLATALGIGCNFIYAMAPGEDLWERLNIEETELRELINAADKRLWAMFCSLFPDSTDCKAY